MKSIELFYKKQNNNNLSLIAGNIAILYKEGISMIMIIELLSELPLNKAYEESIQGIKEYIINGESLENSFRVYSELYPEFFVGMIAMGEKSGNLYRVLKGLEEYYKFIVFLKDTVKNALAYPILILISTIFLLIFLMFFVIPNIYNFYISLNINMPKICEMVYKLSNYILSNPVIFFIYIFDTALLVYFLYKNYMKNKIICALNKVTIYREFNEFFFISILGIIIKSGVNLSEGLIYAERSFTNNNIKERFISLNNSILSGETISRGLMNKGYYSNYTISIIKLGEEGGSIDERLDFLITYLEKKLLSNISNKIAIIQPASILVIGGIVISFLLVFIVPIFSSLYEVAL